MFTSSIIVETVPDTNLYSNNANSYHKDQNIFPSRYDLDKQKTGNHDHTEKHAIYMLKELVRAQKITKKSLKMRSDRYTAKRFL